MQLKTAELTHAMQDVLHRMARARRARDGFFPKEGVNPDRIHGIDDLMKEAIGAKFLAAPLTQVQLNELIQIIPR